jgi:hypothetical protein
MTTDLCKIIKFFIKNRRKDLRSKRGTGTHRYLAEYLGKPENYLTAEEIGRIRQGEAEAKSGGEAT